MHLNPSPFSPPSCMEGVGWEHGELAWSLHASYPCSIPHPTPLPHLRHRPLCVSVMLSPYFSTFFERRKKGRSHMKLSFMAILIHCEQLLLYLIASCIPNSFCKWNFLHFHIKHPQKLGRHISFGVVNTEAKKRWLTGPRESEKDEKEKEEKRAEELFPP